jgi:hypothetical protein
MIPMPGVESEIKDPDEVAFKLVPPCHFAER